jgi:hypothetical protein
MCLSAGLMRLSIALSGHSGVVAFVEGNSHAFGSAAGKLPMWA